LPEEYMHEYRCRDMHPPWKVLKIAIKQKFKARSQDLGPVNCGDQYAKETAVTEAMLERGGRENTSLMNERPNPRTTAQCALRRRNGETYLEAGLLRLLPWISLKQIQLMQYVLFFVSEQ
jgi:hypothetical protein